MFWSWYKVVYRAMENFIQRKTGDDPAIQLLRACGPLRGKVEEMGVFNRVEPFTRVKPFTRVEPFSICPLCKLLSLALCHIWSFHRFGPYLLRSMYELFGFACFAVLACVVDGSFGAFLGVWHLWFLSYSMQSWAGVRKCCSQYPKAFAPGFAQFIFRHRGICGVCEIFGICEICGIRGHVSGIVLGLKETLH